MVACGRLFGRAAAFVRQPPVIGEVLSGILLGPSLLGAISPEAEAYLFPGSVRSILAYIAQAGVILYMFLVGLEFDIRLLRQRTLSLIATSQATVLVPFALGCALAIALPATLVPPDAPHVPFVLFMGVAMSITAFPVLARILTDRGQTRTALGTAALACAAINDVTAWILLALVVGVTRAMPTSGIPGEFAIAFAAGAVIPAGSGFARNVIRWLGGAVTVLLLPAFFALTGLRTELGLLSSSRDWLLCGAIVTAATAGKLGGAVVASRLAGHSWRFAVQLGALMNTRGLMELIVLAVGLDAGIITPALFTMMVIMAVVTTGMTGPLLDSVSPGREGDCQQREERAHA